MEKAYLLDSPQGPPSRNHDNPLQNPIARNKSMPRLGYLETLSTPWQQLSQVPRLDTFMSRGVIIPNSTKKKHDAKNDKVLAVSKTSKTNTRQASTFFVCRKTTFIIIHKVTPHTLCRSPNTPGCDVLCGYGELVTARQQREPRALLLEREMATPLCTRPSSCSGRGIAFDVSAACIPRGCFDRLPCIRI